MTTTEQKRYRVVEGRSVSCRISGDPAADARDDATAIAAGRTPPRRFADWSGGQSLDNAPAHLNISFLLQDGAIEEVPASNSRRPKWSGELRGDGSGEALPPFDGETPQESPPVQAVETEHIDLTAEPRKEEIQ